MFDYGPTSFTPDATGYIRRVVKIEMGARGRPLAKRNEDHHFLRCVKNSRKAFASRVPKVKVLSAERTLLGKGHHPSRRNSIVRWRSQCRTGSRASLRRLSRIGSQRSGDGRRCEARTARTSRPAQKPVLQNKLGALLRRSESQRERSAAHHAARAPLEMRCGTDYTRMQQMFFGTPPEFDKIIAQFSTSGSPSSTRNSLWPSPTTNASGNVSNS